MCPHCECTIANADQNFCMSCGHDLRPHQTKCPSCDWGYHPALNCGNPPAYCAMCGTAMPEPDLQQALPSAV